MKKTDPPITLKLTIMFLSAAISTSLNLVLPIREVLNILGIPGPAGGIAVFGGFIFTFWIVAAYLIAGCQRLSCLSTAILIPSFCMLFSPWYGVVDPPWFGIYGILAFTVAGAVVEWMYRCEGGLKSLALGGGLSNMLCYLVTLIAIGAHTDLWPPQAFIPLNTSLSFTSGLIGSLLAYLLIKTGKV